MSIELYVTTVETTWDNRLNETIVVVYGIDRDGNQQQIEITGFLPYFYVPTTEFEEHEDALRLHEAFESAEGGYSSVFGDELTKITSRYAGKIKELGGLFEETFELDVWHTVRFRIDLGIYTGIAAPSGRCHLSEIKPVEMDAAHRILTFDIETDDRGAFPEPGERPILSIVAHDSFADEYVAFVDFDGRTAAEALPAGKPEGIDTVHYYADEKAMLAGFVDFWVASDPDIISGWHIEGFDVPYLVRRLENLYLDTGQLGRGSGGVRFTNRGDVRISGRITYDLLDAYKRTKRGELKSYSLNSVAEHELDEAKVDHSGQSIYELWTDDVDKLLRYNAHDVRLVVELDRTCGLLAFAQALAGEVGCDLNRTVANNQIIETLVRRKLHVEGLVGPTAKHEKKEKKYEGAYVVDAFTGVAENVVGVDLDSLYPYTMWMLNASPEVRVGEEYDGPVARAPNGARFRLDQEGIFTQLVDEAIELKTEAKEARNSETPGTPEHSKFSERYDVRKTIVNSLYGTSGWEHFFLYDEATAEAVTTMGQEVIKTTQRFINGRDGAEVIYGDTDSNYVRFPAEWDRERCLEAATELATELNETVYPQLADEWGMGARPDSKWRIVVESFAERFFQAGKKKRYAMLVTWQDGHETEKMKITGFDTNRSDTAQLTEDLQSEILESILQGADGATLGQLVYQYAQRITDDADWLYIGIPQGISKPLDDYANPTAQVRGAKIANEMFGTNFGAGSKPLRVYVRGNIIDSDDRRIDVICFDDETAREASAAFSVDMKRMTEVLIERPVESILEAVGVDTDAAIRGQVQSGLDRFL